MTEQVDAVVIGAGVIGLAVARRLALAGLDTIVLEATGAIGTETSARNSEVIHAGLYYPNNSLKARLCVIGKQMLYGYCHARGIGHRRCGKLIVAADQAEAAVLADIDAGARANGVTDLRLLSAAEARTLEPALTCAAALLSPSTGIVDSHGLMLALLGDAEAAGAMIAFHSPVAAGRVGAGGLTVETAGPTPMALGCRVLVNAAGLDAPAVAARFDGLPADDLPRTWLAKGSYFTLAGRIPFRHLIYPVPCDGGLGVHLTIDLAGQARFGPDVEAVETRDYRVDPRRGDRFYAAVRRYWPGLPDAALLPGYAGIRPRITPPGVPLADFRIDGPETHGIGGLVNLFGIESPGLTSVLALADVVGTRLGLSPAPSLS